MGLGSGEPGAPGGPWQRLAPMEQMGVRGCTEPLARPQPKPVCLPAAAHPTRHTADSWQLRAPPVGSCGAAVPPPYGGVVPRVFKGSSRWARLSARAPCSSGVCDSVTAAQAMESGHGEVMDTCGAELERARSRERPP